MRGHGREGRQHAVVVGGSVAGLLTAAVLARHFDEVTIVERDRVVDEVAPRRGTPQARHAHLLLGAGARAMAEVVPDLPAALERAGAVRLEGGRDVGFMVRDGWLAGHDREIPFVALSRDLLEHVLRGRVRQLPNITARVGRVSQLDLRAGRVRGVMVEGERLAADLVVDATGRGSRLLQTALDGTVTETVVDAGFGYSTVWLSRRPQLPNGWKMVTVSPSASSPRGGVIVPIENGGAIMSFNGPKGFRPPGDRGGFVEFARRIRTPVFADAIDSGEELGEIGTTRSTVNRFRHVWRAGPPPGLIAVGDAVCTLNPVYAQGMTVAAMTAVALDAVLASGTSKGDLSKRFSRAQARVCLFPWLVATIEDFRFPSTRGTRMPGLSMVEGALNGLFEAAVGDPVVASSLQRTVLLLDHPATLVPPALRRVAALRLVGRPL